MASDQMTPHRLATLLDLGEAAALADVLEGSPEPYRTSTSVHRTGGASSLLAPNGGGTWLNTVIGLGLAEPATEAMVDALVTRHKQAGVPFLVKVNPLAEPPALSRWLEERGVAARSRQCKLYKDLSEPPADIDTSLRIERIDRRWAPAFAAIVCSVFGFVPQLLPVMEATVGRPGWVHFLAFDGETPAAAGAIYVSGETAWLGCDSTLPQFRRRGAHGAIMAARVRAAAEAGARWMTTDTRPDRPGNPNPSLHNMLRNGFQVAYHRTYHVWEPCPLTG